MCLPLLGEGAAPHVRGRLPDAWPRPGLPEWSRAGGRRCAEGGRSVRIWILDSGGRGLRCECLPQENRFIAKGSSGLSFPPGRSSASLCMRLGTLAVPTAPHLERAWNSVLHFLWIRSERMLRLVTWVGRTSGHVWVPSPVAAGRAARVGRGSGGTVTGAGKSLIGLGWPCGRSSGPCPDAGVRSRSQVQSTF